MITIIIIIIIIIGSESTLTMNSHNTAVVAGNSVTLSCTSNNSIHSIAWYNSSCALPTSTSACQSDEVLFRNTTGNPPSRFTVVASIIAGQYVCNITIFPTATNDAAIYSCADPDEAYGELLIVLGKISSVSILSLRRPY